MEGQVIRLITLQTQFHVGMQNYTIPEVSA